MYPASGLATCVFEADEEANVCYGAVLTIGSSEFAPFCCTAPPSPRFSSHIPRTHSLFRPLRLYAKLVNCSTSIRIQAEA